MSSRPPPLFSQLARGGAAVVTMQGLRLVLRFGSMITLARLLQPDDFGLFGIAALGYGLLQTVRDLGLASVAVQQGDLTPRESTLFFWLQFGAGALVAVLAAAAAPLLAARFGSPALQPMLTALGVAFFLNGVGGQFRVELSRALHFRALSVIDAAGLTAGIAAAIGLATLGAGYWALVAMVLVQELVTLLGAVMATPWRPIGRPDFAGTAAYVRSGLHLSGFSLVHYAMQMIDQACVATRLGSHALGLYGRAWQLGTLPTHGLIAGLTNWMVQGLVKLRDQPADFRAWCGRVLNALAYLCTLLGAVFFVAPEPVLAALLGPQWTGAAPALRWLALTLPLQPWLFVQLWLLTACRHERRLLGWSLARLAAFAGALAIFPTDTLAAVAAIMAVVQWLLLPASVLVTSASTPLRARDLAAAHAQPLLLGALLATALQLTKPWWTNTATAPAITIITVVSLLVVAGFAAASTRARNELTAAAQMLRGRAV